MSKKVLKWACIISAVLVVIGLITTGILSMLDIGSKTGDQLLMTVMTMTLFATIVNCLSTFSVFLVDYLVYRGVKDLGRLMAESTDEIRKQFGELNGQVMSFLTTLIQAQKTLSPAQQHKPTSFNLKMGFVDDDKGDDDDKYVKVVKVKL